MESGYYSSWRSDDSFELMDNEDEKKALNSMNPVLGVPQIRTPIEPMELLARSTSVSASEVRKGLMKKQKQYLGDEMPNSMLEIQQSGRSNIGSRRGSFGKWFNQKDFSNNSLKKKDRMRVENAHIHSAISIAGLAAALAAVTAAQKSNGSKMDMALASATELLASHCLDVAESSGADSDRVKSVARSAMDVQTPGDLLTLTAAAATALRGEAALKARFPKESKKKNAGKSQYVKSIAERQDGSTLQCPPVVGELLQVTPKGTLQCKNVSVYVNKKSRVMVKIKGKQARGAFTKKNKCLVYAICDEAGAGLSHREEREGSEEVYFGVSTAQGLMEFKCKNKIDRQRWVDGIKDLFCQVSSMEQPSVHTVDSLSDDHSM